MSAVVALFGVGYMLDAPMRKDISSLENGLVTANEKIETFERVQNQIVENQAIIIETLNDLPRGISHALMAKDKNLSQN